MLFSRIEFQSRTAEGTGTKAEALAIVIVEFLARHFWTITGIGSAKKVLSPSGQSRLLSGYDLEKLAISERSYQGGRGFTSLQGVERAFARHLFLPGLTRVAPAPGSQRVRHTVPEVHIRCGLYLDTASISERSHLQRVLAFGGTCLWPTR